MEHLSKIAGNQGLGRFWGLLGWTWEAFWSQGGAKLKKSGSLAALGVPFGEASWTLFGTGSFQIDFLSFFCYMIFRFVFLSILGDFRAWNLSLFQVADMPEVF